MSLDKAALLALFAPKIIDQTITGIGPVRLRELSAPEISDIRESCKAAEEKANFGFKLVIASLVNDDGQPVFAPSDLPALRTSAQARIESMVEAVMAVNGFKVASTDIAKEVAVKN